MWERRFNPTTSNVCKKLSDRFLIKRPCLQNFTPSCQGFSLIELMITISIMGILAVVAVPYLVDHLQRGKISQGISTLTQLAIQMEKSYLDNRSYSNSSGCIVASPTDDNFSYSCTSDGQTFTWVAESKDGKKFVYSINHNGQRETIKFNGSTVASSDCWMMSNSTQDCY